jgi:hypothetical protein
MRKINFKSAFISFTIAFVIAFFITTLSSCEKEKATMCTITVNDSGGLPVEGADVILSKEGEISPQGSFSSVFQQKETGANGQADFEFQYEAILDVIVEKTVGNDSAQTGQSVVRLLKNKIVFKTVVIN